jgi:GTP diphosphokinase / guanosine-3',5'-bis(diphosphate) 3'-diphosphatase
VTVADDPVARPTIARAPSASSSAGRAALVDGPPPWLRETAHPGPAVLVARYRSRHPGAPTDRLEAAYALAEQVHEGQRRSTGEAYITHPLAVASILAEMSLDDTTIIAALLHDAVEDTPLTLEEVGAAFGPDVCAIVDGVTKLDRVRFESKEAQQAATMRKMLVAMAKDLRVLLIKLADRLHNMRTLAFLPVTKQVRIAQETLDVYAPLAHRLGIQDMKWQLEDLAFAVLEPKKYSQIENLVSVRAPERDQYIDAVADEVGARLAELGIGAEVKGRSKHFWSIYEKMVVRGKEFEEIHDLVGIRVVVDSVKDCYGALGSIHAIWKPIQGRFKDYIAMPKFNLYQSLHTTVVGPQGKPVEFQIRTREMHLRAEHGIAAHWGYKEETSPAHDLAWLQRLVDWHGEASDAGEFMDNLRVDLEQGEVFVFTPKGDVVTLVSGSTPIDFAYHVHTDVGHRCIGARINGRLVALDSKLQSGDTVEIFTSKVEGAGPSKDWLKIVVTPRAKSKIRHWFSRERREDALEQGREELVKALRGEGLPVERLMGSHALAQAASGLNYVDLDALYVAIGEHHVSGKAVAQRLQKELRGGEDQLPTTVLRPPRKPTSKRRKAGVHVEGLDDVLVRLSKCCTPVPGDDIIGFVTRGRGVSVHRADCANAMSLAGQADRLIDVEWDSDPRGSYVVGIEVVAFDRARLLSDVSRSLSDNGVNILGCTIQTTPDRVAYQRFEFEMADPSHLESVLSAIRRIDSVWEAHRIVPSGAKVD